MKILFTDEYPDDTRDFIDYEEIHETLAYIDREYLNNELIVLADLGLWDGRVHDYKNICYLENIIDAFEDYNTLYVDRQDLKLKAVHHDGTNYYTIREFKDISDEQRENFLDKYYRGDATQRDISRYTKAIGKIVKENF